MKPHIEIILPLYNELENLPPLMKELNATSQKLKDQATVTFLFVDDGSNDGSSEWLEELHATRSDIRVIRLIHNFGHSAAIACGLEYFEADIAVVMDVDLQDAPSVVPELFERWKQGSKTVVAERNRRAESAQFLFRIFYFLLHQTAKTLPPINFGTYCLLDRTVVQRLRSLREKNRYFPGLVVYSSSHINSVRTDRKARAHGHSRVGTLGLLQLAITALLSFSSAPIRVVSVLGILSSTCALVAGMAIVGIKLFSDKAIPGWASIMTVIFLASGIQLLCLGIIGEYIARIYEEVKARPLYLVEKVSDHNDMKDLKVA